MNDKSKTSLGGTEGQPTTGLLTLVTVIFQVLQLQLQRVCAGVRLLLQHFKLGGVNLRQADALGLHL